MKILQSEQLGSETVEFGAESQKLDIYDGLSTPVTDDIIVLSTRHQQQIEQFAHDALANYGGIEPEQTQVQRVHGVASLVTRVDCTILDGMIRPYELEDSPSGLGITHLMHQRAGGTAIQAAILNHFESVTGDVPFVVVSGSRRHGTDDPIIYGPEKYHFAVDDFTLPKHLNGDQVIVKTVPGVTDSQLPYKALAERALAPLMSEGDKSYGERLGLFTPISAPGDLLRDEAGNLQSQVLKASLGSMAMGISIFLTSEDKKQFGRKSSVTASRLESDLAAFVKRDGMAYTQPFRPAMQIHNAEGRNNMILRVFVLSHPEGAGASLRTEVIGGCFVARPEPIVHGASNSVGGAVLVQ